MLPHGSKLYGLNDIFLGYTTGYVSGGHVYRAHAVATSRAVYSLLTYTQITERLTVYDSYKRSCFQVHSCTRSSLHPPWR